MKVITVRQPWAWAIFHGKDVENRTSWNYKHRGVFAVHAGVRLDDDFLEVDRLAGEPVPMMGAPRGDVEAQLGGIVGLADLVDVHWWEDCLDRDSGRMCSRWAQDGQHHLVLREQRPLLELVECPGALGVWEAPAVVTRAVKRVIR